MGAGVVSIRSMMSLQRGDPESSSAQSVYPPRSDIRNLVQLDHGMFRRQSGRDELRENYGKERNVMSY